MAPKALHFVNKNAESTSWSRCEAAEDTDVRRHVRMHITQATRARRRSTSLQLAPSTVSIIHSPHERCSPLSPSSSERRALVSEVQHHGGRDRDPIEPSALPENVQSDDGDSTATKLNDSLPDEDNLEAGSPHQYICCEGESTDPFNCSSVPMTKAVHQCLVHFESSWFPRMLIRPGPSENFASLAHDLVRECVSDRLQMLCVLAAMAVKLENFHNVTVPGSKQYIISATRVLQRRLSTARLDGRLLYAIMKLYQAEACTSDLERALIHLKGARAVYDRLDKWQMLDARLAPTFSASSGIVNLPQLFKTSAVFPTIADPGSAMSCFAKDIAKFYALGEGFEPDTAQTLLAYANETVKEHGVDTVGSLHRIITGMIEFTAVRRCMSSRTVRDLPLPSIVETWAHLRRQAFTSRLLGLNAAGKPFFHFLRVALIIWMGIDLDVTGGVRLLEIVAIDLRNKMRMIPLVEMAKHAAATIWMLILGAMVADPGEARPWFVRSLANASVLFGMSSTLDTGQWFSFLENICRKCFYCQVIERQRLGDLARKLYLHHCQDPQPRKGGR